MKIKHNTYEALTTKQRILAAIEAAKRNDADEIQRLICSIPKQQNNTPLSRLLDEIDGNTAGLPSEDRL